jgi:hypothetical protein
MRKLNPPRVVLTGQIFGLLTVKAPYQRTARGWLWRCLCSCGKTRYVPASSLRSGNSQSCGCARVRVGPKSHMFKHGHAVPGKRSREWLAWNRMIGRCYRPGASNYKHYGARGIRVCDRWRHDFTTFLADMGSRPVGYSLGRIDNDGDYTPENCRWETTAQQNANRSNTAVVTVGGRKLRLFDLARSRGILYATLRHRLVVQKQCLEVALRTG